MKYLSGIFFGISFSASIWLVWNHAATPSAPIAIFAMVITFLIAMSILVATES